MGLKVGEVLDGKYRLDAVLGEGGFGRVMRATDLASGRVVAIKFLKSGNDAGANSRAARFRREMRAIASLESPHTLTLYDYGQTPDGAHYMVTELVEGQDLSDLLIRRETLSSGECVHILLQVLYSLAEAHALGVVHRDIKPSNIRLFSAGDDPLRVKVLDFGLAHWVDGREARLTATGRAIGTPRYMSPEHLAGGELAPATDIYSLGLVALEMLEGRESTLLGTRAATATLTVAPGTAVDPELRAIVDGMLKTDASKRFQGAPEVTQRMRGLRRRFGLPKAPRVPGKIQEPLAEPLPTVSDEAARTDSRTLIPLAVALSCVGVLIAGAIVLRQTDDPRQPRVIAPVARSSLLRLVAEPTTDSGTPQTETANRIACSGRIPFRGQGTLSRLGGGEYEAYVPLSYDGTTPSTTILLFNAPPAPPGADVRLGLADLPPPPTERTRAVAAKVIEALGEKYGFVVVSLALSRSQDLFQNSRIHAEQVFRAVDAIEEGLCVDPTRYFAVAVAENTDPVVAVSCAIPFAGVVAVGGTTRAPVCAMPHMRLAHKKTWCFAGVTSAAEWSRTASTTLRRGWGEANRCLPDPQRDGVCEGWTCEAPLFWCEVGSSPAKRARTNCGGFTSKFDYAARIARFVAAVGDTRAERD